MFNQSRQSRPRIFVFSMFAILALSVIVIYYVATQVTERLNVTSIDTGGSVIVSRDENEKEVIPSPSQVETAQLSRPIATQNLLPDLAPTLVERSTNVFLLPDLAPTLVKSPRDAYDLPDLAPTLVNPLLSVYQYSDLAPTLVKVTEGPDRLPDLAPTIVKSQDTNDRLPDLEPTLP